MTKLITIAPLDDDGTANGLYHYKICGLDNYWLTPNLYERGLTEGIETLTFSRLFDVQTAIGMHVCSLDRPLAGKEVRFLRTDISYTQTEQGSVLGYKDKQRVAAAEKAGAQGARSSRPLALTGRFVAETCLSGLARATAAGRASLQAPRPDAGPGPAQARPSGRADLESCRRPPPALYVKAAQAFAMRPMASSRTAVPVA